MAALTREDPDATDQVVWDALLSGEEVDRRVGDPHEDHPARASQWSRERRVPAGLLQHFMTAGTIDSRAAPRWVKLTGVHVVGTLDLGEVEVLSSLTLVGCALDSLVLTGTTARSIILEGCTAVSLDLARATVRGSVRIARSFCAERLNLLQARVEGGINLAGTHIVGADSVALVGDRLMIDRALFMRDGFYAGGEMRLLGAKVGGQLVCEGAHFSAAEVALNLDGATVDGEILLIDRIVSGRDPIPFKAEGEIRLRGTRVGGTVECSGAFTAPQRDSRVAVRGSGAAVAGDVVLAPAFHGTGELRFIGARIERDLRCRAAALENPGDTALDLSRTTIGGALIFAP